MKILVLIKQVPDSTTPIRIRPDGEDIERAGVKLVVNPFDEFAIELAVRLREARKDVEVISALTVGPAAAAEALRTALAIGADDGIHLLDAKFEALDELQTAALIAAVVRTAGYDLIIRGKQEIDLDSGQLGPALAECLDRPHVGAVTAFELSPDGQSFQANRRIEGADEVLKCPLPALVTIEKGLVECRYASLPNIMKAKKKPVRTIAAADVPAFADITGSVGGTEVHRLEPPPARPAGKLLTGDAAQTVPELARLLREEAKAI